MAPGNSAACSRSRSPRLASARARAGQPAAPPAPARRRPARAPGLARQELAGLVSLASAADATHPQPFMHAQEECALFHSRAIAAAGEIFCTGPEMIAKLAAAGRRAWSGTVRVALRPSGSKAPDALFCYRTFGALPGGAAGRLEAFLQDAYRS